MTTAQELIADVLARHYPSIDNEVGTQPYWCGDDNGCGTWDRAVHRHWRDHLAAEIDKALGGLTLEWASGQIHPGETEYVVTDGSRGPSRAVAEKCLYFPRFQLINRWVSGWTEAER